MMRHTPKLKYCGLSIVLSNPSRFDKEALLSGRAGALLNEALYPTCNRFQCDIRLKEETAPLLPNTKLLLLLGESCLQKFTNNEAQINAQRGNLNWHESIPVVATYGAQDALDPKDLEGEHNELLKMEEEIYSEEPSETDNKRRYGKTARSNYEFWFRKDIEKVRYILENGILSKKEFNYIIYPDSETIIKILSNTYGSDFYFDIETDPNLNITCFAFSFGYPDVYVVPVLDHDYSKAYGNLPAIFRALCLAISRNTCVAHNGSGFDYVVLAHKYHIPIDKVYDTMLAQNRCVHQDSVINTIEGNFTIKELEGKSNFYTWSWKNGKPFPSKVNWVKKTGENKKLVNVKLWRRKFGGIEVVNIKCTPDHKFLVKDKWVEAKDLKAGESLSRVSHVLAKETGIDYHTINIGNKAFKAHRHIWECLNRPLKHWEDIHHKDENKLNNHPDNLEVISHSEHLRQHTLKRINEGKFSAKGNTPYNKGSRILSFLSKEKLQELYNAKMSQIDIAKKFNVNQSVVSRTMKEYGITSRGLKDAQQLRRQNEKNCKVISITDVEGEHDVYCMDVEDTHCFSANGVIVHNCFPEVEKSLGHCISLPWMFESFHKDESGFAFGNKEQAMNLWKYCGKDVSSLVLLKEAQLKYAAKIPGLTSSIMAVNSYVKAYTAMTLTGLRYDQTFLDETIKANDRLCNQYLRILTVLIGKKNMEAIKRNGKGSIASSSKQAIRYFHDMLQYKIVLRSKKTKLPSLAAKAMFKLKLAHPIMPTIDLIIAYRILAKETGSLKFKPYKTNEENNIG